jgi:hypothetical protein
MRRRVKGVCGLGMLLLAGCMPPGRAADLAMPIPPGEARIVVYRNGGVYESLQWVPVTLDGRKIGGAGPDAVFLRDVPPGTYRIGVVSQSLWPGQTKTVVADAGQTIYVKVGVVRGASSSWSEGWGVEPTFVPEIIDPEVARREIAGLS